MMFVIESEGNLYGPFTSADDAAKWVSAQANVRWFGHLSRWVMRPVIAPESVRDMVAA